MAAPQCTKCLRFTWDHACEAFPCGIPDEIFLGGFDHRQPYPGDDGFRFEKIAKEASAGSRQVVNPAGEGGIGELTSLRAGRQGEVMIIGKCFDGDNDEELKMHQHSCYDDMLRHWIELADGKLMHYQNVPEWEKIMQQWRQFRERGTFDHRCIQAHHDLIAQRYRMIQDNPPYIMFLGKDWWEDFFRKGVARLMGSPEMLKLFVTALACANTTEGYDAEDGLMDLMRGKYHIDKPVLKNIDNIEREVMLPIELICIGGEGGCMTIFGWKSHDGEWHFQRETNECVLIEMLAETEEEFRDCPGIDMSEFVDGWDEALKLLNRYPWPCLPPLYVHPEFAGRVMAALKDAPEEYRDLINWRRWEAVCAGKEPFGMEDV